MVLKNNFSWFLKLSSADNKVLGSRENSSVIAWNEMFFPVPGVFLAPERTVQHIIGFMEADGAKNIFSWLEPSWADKKDRK